MMQESDVSHGPSTVHETVLHDPLTRSCGGGPAAWSGPAGAGGGALAPPPLQVGDRHDSGHMASRLTPPGSGGSRMPVTAVIRDGAHVAQGPAEAPAACVKVVE